MTGISPCLLIIDDDVNTVRLISETLSDDARLFFTTDSARALGLAVDTKPDLILLDTEMPAMDGFAVCTALKANPETAGSAVIGFSSVMTGSADAPLTFTVRNSGSANLTGISVTKDGANAADFTLNTAGMAATLAPANTSTFTVTFAPSATGARTATLHLASNDATKNPFDIAFAGTGLSAGPAPDLAVEQPAGSPVATGGSRSFGTVVMPKKPSLTFTLRNTGMANLDNLAVQLSGTNASDFKVTGNLSAPVKPGKSKTFKVQFVPQTAGNKQATLRITSNVPSAIPYEITLSGNAVAKRAAAGVPLADFAAAAGGTAIWSDDDAGRTRLFEMATGGDPQNPSPSPCRVALDGNRLTMLYPRATAAAQGGIGFAVEWSADLEHWTSDGVAESMVSEDQGAGIQQWQAQVPLSGAGPKFLRLRVTSPP